MKYGDELDRIPADGVSRRQFLAAGRLRAARIAVVVLPGGRPQHENAPTETAPETDKPSSLLE